MTPAIVSNYVAVAVVALYVGYFLGYLRRRPSGPSAVTPEAVEWATRESYAVEEREVIIQWLRECGYEHEQTGKLSRIALGKTFAKIALAIERGEHLDGGGNGAKE